LNKKKPHLISLGDVVKEPLLSDNSVNIDDPGSAETLGLDPDNRALDMRKDSEVERSKIIVRDPSETRTLPVFAVSTKTIIDKDIFRAQLYQTKLQMDSVSSICKKSSICNF
jgi:hypothetical protein